MATNHKSIEEIREEVIKVLKTVYDPEIWVNIYDLGLIYDIDIDENQNLHIKMTLTSPMCPLADSVAQQVKTKLSYIKDIQNVDVELVWEPAWNKDMITNDGKLALGLE
ncbi:MAG: iron-sulfur cluster assembly protein [Candidatus Marinimicrobia bacterium]|nr:iron-sulfur cluster assembly protein [Candidatus Neomarinimicrobiota bacterium]MDD5582546.1 iron-sulfur cluster assembly protein [Candidatus Neomarinimicrobiota bacterium]